MEESNGCRPAHADNRQSRECTNAALADTNTRQPSPNSQPNLDIVAQNIQSGEASLEKDACGNPIIDFKNQRNIPLIYVDKSQANLIATPKPGEDTQKRIEVCLEMINFVKNNRAPNGVVLDEAKIRAKHGKYREGKEMNFLHQTLGSGAMAGDIVVIKDNTTDIEHAQKTVMISEFREEEVRAWVDLDGDGLCPSLYAFHLEYNQIVFRMEKLERAITLRDVIDIHMENLRKKEPDLVRPFSLYVFQGLLSAVRHMHDKNWTHRDLHGGNVMVQGDQNKLLLKVLDFGKANRLRGKERYDLSGEKDDIYQAIRLFSAIYLGQEFESPTDLEKNYKQYIKKFQSMSMEDKTEVFQLIDATMSVAESGKKMDDTIQEIGDRIREKDDMMQKVAAILFSEEDYQSIHEDHGIYIRPAQEEKSGLVVVTGASGYIATHVVKQLQEGGYKVRGTVRSLQNENKLKHLHDLCPEAAHKLELVEADLTKPESWEAAVKDAEFVIHVASPFPATSPKDENEVIQPAVEGTQSVLKACVAAKTVKRVVLTSSCAAISWGAAASDKVCTEEDWIDVEKLDAYAKSKTLAEKAAWDFVKELPDSDKIELAVVNPAYVMGPVLHGSQCTSMECLQVVKRLLERAMPFVPKLNFPVVDVRDVAAAHIKAMVTPEAAGRRHIIMATNMYFKEMALILANEFDPQGYNVPTMNCPHFALWMTSLFDKTIKMILLNVNKVYKFDNTRMKEVLGITPRDPKETLIDMAYSMVEGGFIKKSKKYKGPHAAEEEEAKKEEEKKEEEKKEEGTDEKPKENGEIKEDKGDDDLKKEDDGEKREENKESEEKKGEEIKKDEKTEEKKEEKPEEKTEEAPAESK